MIKAFTLSLVFTSLSIQASNLESAASDTEQLQQTISRAITKFEQTSRENWSYKISKYENEEGTVTSSIEVFDPSLSSGQRWSLLRINGEEPTQKQLRKFTRDKVKQAEEKEKGSISVALRKIVQLQGIELVSEQTDSFQASFDVNLERLGEEASERLKGLLTYDKAGQFIRSIEITNTDTFSPVFSAKITDFNLAIRFTQIDEAVLPYQNELSMKGTFAFFTEIDEVSKDTISDYRYVGVE